MSNFLQFPVGVPPPGAMQPPYARFHIDGTACTDMAPQIPLALVLHYVPSLRQDIQPSAELTTLPWPTARLLLRSPTININITRPGVATYSLWYMTIIMLSLAGRHTAAQSLQRTDMHMNMTHCMAIHHTWLALELPWAGLAGIHLQMQTRLMEGPAVTQPLMKAIWESFPRDSAMVRLMVHNWVQAFAEGRYAQQQVSEIRRWYLSERETCRAVEAVEKASPAFKKAFDAEYRGIRST